MSKKWKKTITGNEVLSREDFYISFRPAGNGFRKAKTALVKKSDDYFILNGDFRREYEEIFDKGFDECYKFYLSQAKYKSCFSSDAPSVDNIKEALDQLDELFENVSGKQI